MQEFYNKVKSIYDSIYADILGGGSLDKCFLMAYIFKECKFKNYVEIGVYRGKSLYSVSVAIKENGGKAYGIDPYLASCLDEKNAVDTVKKYVEEATSTLNFERLYQEVAYLKGRFGFDNIVDLIRDTSEGSVDFFIKNGIEIDMLHIDGNHDTSFVESDAINYIPLVRNGGIIIFDDIDWPSVSIVYKKAKEKYIPVFETDNYGIILIADKTKDNTENVSNKDKIIRSGVQIYSSLKNSWDPVDLVIVDDTFPYQICTFNNSGFTEYLEYNPGIGHEKTNWNGYRLPETIQAKLAYFCSFDNNLLIESIEQNQIPFIFELCTEGTFKLNNPDSDKLLRRVTKSNFFRKIIVTQEAAYDYLIEKRICSNEQIQMVSRGVFLSEKATLLDDKSKQLLMQLIEQEILDYEKNMWFVCSDINNESKEAYSKLKEQYVSLEYYTKHIQKSYSNLESDYKELQKKYALVETDAKNIRKEYLELKEYNDSKEITYGELENGYKELQERYSLVETDAKNIRKEYLELKENNERKEITYGEMENSYKELKNHYSMIMADADRLSAEYTKLKEENDRKDKVIDDMEEKILDYQLQRKLIENTVWWKIFGRNIKFKI